MKHHKDHAKEPFPFIVNDTTLPLPLENSLRFRKNLL